MLARVHALAWSCGLLGCAADPPAGDATSTDASGSAQDASTTSAADDGGSSSAGGGGDASTSTTAAGTSDDSTTESGSGHPASDSSTTSDAWLCRSDSAEFECTVPHECDGGESNATACGQVNSWFDAQGCLRLACSDADGCPEGMRCHSPSSECDVCAPLNVGCSDEIVDGAVRCVCSSDGSCAGAFCVFEEEFPRGECGE